MDLDELRETLRKRREYGWMAPKFVPVSADDGHVVVHADATIDHVNVAKNLHGGAGATLIDVVGTLAMGFVEVEIRRGSDDVLCVQGPVDQIPW